MITCSCPAFPLPLPLQSVRAWPQVKGILIIGVMYQKNKNKQKKSQTFGHFRLYKNNLHCSRILWS